MTAAPAPRIYLDHNATAPLVPAARLAMARALEELWGNPSSVHALGRQARAAVEESRQQVAALIGADREEIVFTSGGTEGAHAAIRGLASVDGGPGRRLVSSRLEHPAVLGAIAAAGAEADWLTVGPLGELDLDELVARLRPGGSLVSVALVNHELGTVQPVKEIVARARAVGALVHSDAVQAVGRVPVDVAELGVDALSFSAHKLGGPKGVGALWVRRGLLPRPLLSGGHQERERRAGTENVPGIVGFGAACRQAREQLADWSTKVAPLRDRLEERLLSIPGARRHGHPARRVAGTANLGFEGAPGELVVIALDLEGVAVSSGPACSSGTMAPSPVLLAMGLPPESAREAVRFSLGPANSREEIDRAADLTAAVVARVRAAA